MKEGDWIIVEDYTGDPDCQIPERVSIIGPESCEASGPELMTSKDCRLFRMLDDDGYVYYKGWCYLPHGLTNAAFNPLDNYGCPNAGATTIQYLNEKNEWETL